MTSDYFASEDLTQETFLSAYSHLDSFTGDQMKSWICRIASNKCIDYLKHSGRRQIPTEDEQLSQQPSCTLTPETLAEEHEVYSILEERCKSLKPPYDEIAFLYYCQEQSPEEIAASHNRNVKTIQTQIYRARGMLRKLYEKERRYHER